MLNYSFQIVFNGTKRYYEGFKDSRAIDTSGPVLTYKVENLLPGTTYTFAVRAKTSCGIGGYGNKVVMDTLIDCKYRRTRQHVSVRSVVMGIGERGWYDFDG